MTAETQLEWTDPKWLEEVTTWIRSHVRVSGEITQLHVRLWSTVLSVPTPEGPLWFKAAAPVHAFEAGLVEMLAATRPDLVPELVASDPERGWMLMCDGGERLREQLHSRDDLRRWEEVLPSYAELQLAVARPDELLALGVPDHTLTALPGQLAGVVEGRAALLVDHPEGLSPEELAGVRGRVPEFAEMCAELAALGILETIQHDDLHDGNVFTREGRYVFFDWGDSCVSHPFCTLVVTLRSIAARFDVDPGAPELERVRDAYLEHWTRVARRRELLAAFDLAYRIGTVSRALAWHRFVSARDPAFRDEEGAGPAYGLRLFLADGPIGSWR